MPRLSVPALCVVGCAITLPTLLAAKPPATATVVVDCTDPNPTKHGSVNTALATPAGELTVEIRGVCQEDVVVRRDRVTLRGATGPGTDGIQAVDTTDPQGAVVMVRGARRVAIENLGLSGGTSAGLYLLNSRDQISVSNCRLNGNGLEGLLVLDSFVEVEDTEMHSNGAFGLSVRRNSGLGCTNCSIALNAFPVAVLLQTNSYAVFESSSIADGRVSCNNGSRVTLDSTPIASPVHAIGAAPGCEVQMSGGTLDGSVRASRGSQVFLSGVDQLSLEPSGANVFNFDAHLFVDGGTLLGVNLSFFSNGEIFNGADVGAVGCGIGSDLFCDGSVTRTGSSCGLCP